MNNRLIFLLWWYFFLSSCTTTKELTASSSFTIKTVEGFPNEEPGYGLGVSACYAGIINNQLIMAGGCNFPEPGCKKYYQGIYAAELEDDSLRWFQIGKLPEPAAYGATLVSGDSLILVGGLNHNHSLKTVLSIHLDSANHHAIIHKMLSLPFAADNMAASICQQHLFVLGGNQDNKPSSSILSLNLLDPRTWERVCKIPGAPRVQATACSSGDKIYIWGGFYQHGKHSKVETNGLSYDIVTKKWRFLPSPRDSRGTELTLTGGTIVTISPSNRYFYATGGVNREIFLDAISGRYKKIKQQEYLDQSISFYQFNSSLLTFDTKKEDWKSNVQQDLRLARAGSQMVVTPKGIYYIGGEIKPGLRAPSITKIRPKTFPVP